MSGPAVALTPASPLTFTSQNVGTTSGTLNFSVTNTGSANLTITSVGLSGANAGDFSIVADGCAGEVLTPNQNCVVGIRFSPTLGGTRTATASVTDNATGSPQTIAISGLGYGIPVGSLNTTLLAFNDTLALTTSAAQKVTLSNPGTDTLKIASIAITGSEGDDFSTPVTTCGATPTTLAPGASCTISTTFSPLFSGDKDAYITITDNANNVAGSTQNVGLAGVGDGDPTTTALVSSVSPSTSGQSVTFTATVTPSMGPVPTGSVVFANGATTIGTVTLAGGVAKLPITTLPVGNNAITATYVPLVGGKAAGSESSAIVQVVNPSPTTTTVKSSANPSTSGQSVTFTATVTATTGATPTGTVNFASGGTTIGSGTLSGGVATFSTAALPVGSSSITATYVADSTDATSTSTTLTQVVNVSPTTTTLTSSTNPSTSGESVTFTATVTATTGATPTGTVTFKYGTTTLGTGTLATGKATLAITTLPVGTDSITAVYGGSTTDATSTSSPLSQVVNN